MHKKIRLTVVGSLLTTLLFSKGGQLLAQDQQTINKQLLERIEELEQQLRIVNRKAELADEASAEKAKTTPRLSLGASGFTVQSADTNFVFRIRGYAQADSRFYFDDHSPQNDTFLLRRVRPIFEGTVFEKFDYRLMLDLGSGASLTAGNNSLLQDAYVNARFTSALQLQVGKFKEPVGLERLQSGSNLLFPERAYPTQLLPNRDVGIQLHGSFADETLTYAAGMFNGVADGGSGDFDSTDDDKDFAGRIFAHPFRKTEIEPLQNFGIGISGTYGKQEGSLRSFASPGQQRIFSYRTGAGTAASPNVFADGTHWRLSPQFYWYWGPFGLLGEYAVSSQEISRQAGGPVRNSTLEHSAWQLAASYFLTGEKNSFKAVAPKKPFGLGEEGGWGAWEIAARISQIDFDDASFPNYASLANSADKATTYAIGLNWHLNRHVKASIAYEHTEFDGGTSPLLQSGEQVLFGRVQFGF
jgi:phosphate-selective porin OprO/OprP